ncbi:penicillinase repressor [Methylacidiphilum kamchatkense Kam1]|uniref:Penicillinase repressor n=1 Tax=Methylacidiphilum kamchatkense Kam1 TaxID=1202785 RepID=A0ABR4ZVG8_9BACT|nr:BlaI/MecI/CopY family transcriptional regulator [Methylacidiphilum kamchatkense]KIE57698.1 penicillinase repressor [Methylacidiphilum kamchatkense Kam1]
MEKGALRERVLLIVQERGTVTATEVWQDIRQHHPLSLNTVQTVLNRLVQDRILTRDVSRRPSRYRLNPADEVQRRQAQKTALELSTQVGPAGLTHFVESLETLNPELVQRLERLLAARRQDRT